jgi:hypothetical protein
MVMNVILHKPAKAFKVNYACIFWSSREIFAVGKQTYCAKKEEGRRKKGGRTNKLLASWEPDEARAWLPTV